MSVRFTDRAAAGRELARALAPRYRDCSPLVLGLSRGGVPVAAEVAHGLRADLDVFVVRKVGVPGHRELALGAVASGGVRVLNDDVVRGSAVTETEIERIAQREMAELAARESRYRGRRAATEMGGRTVLLVDDGIATGASIRAAITAVRAHQPSLLVVAAPVAPPQTVNDLAPVVDDICVIHSPRRFGAVGVHYRDFEQVTDDEVARWIQPA